MLVLSGRDVQRSLDLDRLVDAVGEALADLSAGRASMPRRAAATVPSRRAGAESGSGGDALLAVMPAFLGSTGALVTKAVSLFPDNTDRPTHQAVILCFDPDNGTPLALMDGTYITAARTAAGSALATRLLARPDARVVAVIGTGAEARAHARAHARLPGIEVVRVAGRSAAAVDAVVADLADLHDVRVEAAPSIDDAVGSADVVCATTHADRPVVVRRQLRPGTHVNSVGYNSAGEGEVDAATLGEALVVVESRDTALAPPPAGAVELHRAIAAGALSADGVAAIVELGELAAGDAAGRRDDLQLTAYKSVGVAVQDAAAAALVLAAARDQGLGTEVDL
ncbi:MAG TPA: ornithine cyclodeaminase family protein [Acidimicrobiales bacterium]|jgi:ornithine cyclodeaminase/alanine dehydrogenase-like protein (mu-crystallin family)|nr:ornithine cyclodeaminase family protein [Acidimicrobiales bacterium]